VERPLALALTFDEGVAVLAPDFLPPSLTTRRGRLLPPAAAPVAFGEATAELPPLRPPSPSRGGEEDMAAASRFEGGIFSV
jgi:hypothetical protein